MPEQLTKAVQFVKDKWNALEKHQKIKLISAVSVVLLAIVITVYFTTRKNYVYFVSGIKDGAQVMQIENVLKDAGIPYRITDNGTAFMVEDKRLADAKIQTDVNPSTSTLSFTFADALNANSMSITEPLRKQILLQAKQTELAEAITTFDGVVSANVNLSVPETTRFIINNPDKSTASVLVETNRDLTRNEGLSIARFVSRSVEGLELENIEIYDTRYNTLYSGTQDTMGMGVGSISEMQDTEKRQLMLQVRNLFLAMKFNDVQVAPNLVYENIISADSRTTVITPPVSGSESGVVLEEHTESRNVKGSPSADEPGLLSNDQTTAEYQTGNENEYSAKENVSNITRGYNQAETVTSSGPGSYQRNLSSITVNLFRYIPHYQELMRQEDKNFSQTDWENFKITTLDRAVTDDQNLPFYVDSIVNATGIDPSRVTVTVWEVPVFYDHPKTPVEIQQIIMFAVLALLILMLAYGLIRRTQEEEEEIEEEEIEPELSVEDLLVSTQLEEEKEESEQLEEIDYFKDSETKTQIEKFVTERPESVAQLLRNWLNNEEW